MSGYGMEMCHCRAGNDGTPFGRRVYMALRSLMPWGHMGAL